MVTKGITKNPSPSPRSHQPCEMKRYSEIWPEPLPIVTEVLLKHKTYDEVYLNLPDIEISKARPMGAHDKSLK